MLKIKMIHTGGVVVCDGVYHTCSKVRLVFGKGWKVAQWQCWCRRSSNGQKKRWTKTGLGVRPE